MFTLHRSGFGSQSPMAALGIRVRIRVRQCKSAIRLRDYSVHFAYTLVMCLPDTETDTDKRMACIELCGSVHTVQMGIQTCSKHWTIGSWPSALTSRPPSLAFYWPRYQILRGHFSQTEQLKYIKKLINYFCYRSPELDLGHHKLSVNGPYGPPTFKK